MITRRRVERGFTLIEVLAALVIVALGMLGVIEAVTQAARNGTYLRDKTLAHWIAMNLVTERRLAASPPDVAESSGDIDYAGQRWHWTMRVTQTQVETMRRMDVAVRTAEAADGTSLTSLTAFYGAAIGPAGGGTLAWAGSGAPGGSGDDNGTDDQPGGGKDSGAVTNPVKPPPTTPPTNNQ